MPEKKRLSRRRSGAVVVWTAISMTTLLGFAALAVDLGYIYVVKTQLQTAADAAALAGTTAYFQDAALSDDFSLVQYMAVQRAQAVALRNKTMNHATVLDYADVVVGRHDFDNREAPLAFDGRWNAVEVTLRCTDASSNGPVGLFFANIFGIDRTEITATARAAVDYRFGSYRGTEAEGEADLWPFSIQEELYAGMVAGGPDELSYDGGVYGLGDGVPEAKLFPWKWKDEGVAGPDGEDGSGNFGTLNVGIDNQGTDALEEQLENGITPEQLEDEFGTRVLVFFDQDGEPSTYQATGNPGMSVGIKDTLEARIGDIVGFFIHRVIANDGANATYEITGIRFGRVMDVHLTGKPEKRTLTIQPLAYGGGSVLVKDYAKSTGGYVGRSVLVQ